MSKERDAAKTDGITAPPRGCDLAEEFITYLYGEATPEESRVFRQHLDSCAVCRGELTSFGGVREAVGGWRAEALGAIPPLDISGALAPAAETLRPQSRQRSAAAALREFFSLSPLWLRAGTVAAALAVCSLAVLTLARAEVSWSRDGFAFRAGVSERVVREQAPAPAQTGYTEEQVASIVARRVAEATAQFGGQQSNKVVVASDDGVKRRPRAVGQNTDRRRRATRPENRADETLLAEEELPRLSDLLGGSD